MSEKYLENSCSCGHDILSTVSVQVVDDDISFPANFIKVCFK